MGLIYSINLRFIATMKQMILISTQKCSQTNSLLKKKNTKLSWPSDVCLWNATHKMHFTMMLYYLYCIQMILLFFFNFLSIDKTKSLLANFSSYNIFSITTAMFLFFLKENITIFCAFRKFYLSITLLMRYLVGPARDTLKLVSLFVWIH